MTDLKSGWTTAEVVWNKESGEVRRALERVESESYVAWKRLCSDCGTDFLLNKDVVKGFCRNERRAEPFLQLRGRPYKKNDQCFIEQKNNIFVRKLLGYGRLDSRMMQNLINQNDKDWSLLQNHFVSTSKLVSKERVGIKTKK